MMSFQQAEVKKTAWLSV